MQINLNPATLSLLTLETLVDGKPHAVLCDIDGNPLAQGEAAVPCYVDSLTGKYYARIAEVMPSNPDPTSKAAAAALQLRNPIFTTSEDGRTRGYFVVAPDFTLHGRDGQKAAPAPAPAAA